MSRYPLVLSAVVCSPPSLHPQPQFDIDVLWALGYSDVCVHIGPNHGWHTAAREHRLLADEALRVLKSEWEREDLRNLLLATIPTASEHHILITSDSPHTWVNGQHPKAPWAYHIPDLFKWIDNAKGRASAGAHAKLPAANVAEPLTEQQPAAQLSARQETILREMLGAEAIVERNRLSQAEIVHRCQRNADPANWKRDFADLSKRGFITSKAGPSGGCWLTPQGKSLAEHLLADNR